MPSYLPRGDRIGFKAVTLFDENPRHGLPRIQALMIVLDGTNGTPLAVMDGTALTALRTGAASGAATDVLSRADAEIAAIFGAGVQGRTQLEAVCVVRALRKAWIYDTNQEAAERYAREMRRSLCLDVELLSDRADARGPSTI